MEDKNSQEFIIDSGETENKDISNTEDLHSGEEVVSSSSETENKNINNTGDLQQSKKVVHSSARNRFYISGSTFLVCLVCAVVFLCFMYFKSLSIYENNSRKVAEEYFSYVRNDSVTKHTISEDDMEELIKMYHEDEDMKGLLAKNFDGKIVRVLCNPSGNSDNWEDCSEFQIAYNYDNICDLQHTRYNHYLRDYAKYMGNEDSSFGVIVEGVLRIDESDYRNWSIEDGIIVDYMSFDDYEKLEDFEVFPKYAHAVYKRKELEAQKQSELEAQEESGEDVDDESFSDLLKDLGNSLTGNSVSQEEKRITEDEFKAGCSVLNHEDIVRYPDSYNDTQVKVSGRVDLYKESRWTDKAEFVLYDANGDMWWCNFNIDEGMRHLMDGDNVTVYGKCDGTTELRTLLGDRTYVPHVSVIYAE